MRVLRSLLAVFVVASFGGFARADEESDARLRRIDAWIDLAMVGDDADREAAVEALAREGAPAVARLVERLKVLAPPAQTMTMPQTAPAPETQSAADVPVQTVGPPDGQKKADENGAPRVESFTVTGAYIEGHLSLDPSVLPPGSPEGAPTAHALDEEVLPRIFARLAGFFEVVPFEVRSIDGRAVVERHRTAAYRRDAVRTSDGWRIAPGEIREGWSLDIGVEPTKRGERVTLTARSARVARPMRTETIVAEGAASVEIDVPEWTVVSAHVSVETAQEEVLVALPQFGAEGRNVTVRLRIRRE